MAKNSIRDYSATASSNTDIQSVNIDENCPASGINNAIREVMVDLKNVSTGAIALETPSADSLTVTGDLTVDTSTLKVDSTNNRVGIGTTSPDHTLTVSAAASPTLEIEHTGGPYKTNIVLNGNDTEFRGSSGNIEFYTGNNDGCLLYTSPSPRDSV